MDDVKVSVCMMTYNHERYVAQAVTSALMQQTTFAYEIAIGDDCSTDGTRAILQELAHTHPEKIHLWLADRNRGPGVNFVELFAQCRGQYVALLEGDDYWTSPHKLQKQVGALDARPDWALSFHPASCRYEDGLQGPALLPDNWTRPEATILDLFERNFMATGSVMFRNRLFAEFPPWFQEMTLGDWPLHLLNAAHGNIGFLPDVLSVYRVHGGGIWSNQKLGARLDATFAMLSAIDHHFDGKYANAIDQHRRSTLRWLVNKLPGQGPYKPLPLRIAREFARPVRQLWAHSLRRWRGGAPPDSTGTDYSKAA